MASYSHWSALGWKYLGFSPAGVHHSQGYNNIVLSIDCPHSPQTPCAAAELMRNYANKHLLVNYRAENLKGSTPG